MRQFLFKRLLLALNILLLAGTVYVLTRPLPQRDLESGAGVTVETGVDEMDEKSPGKKDDRGMPPTADSGDYDDLIEADLFGVLSAERDQERRDERTEPEPESADPLELELMGTVAGGSDLARAVIQRKDDDSQRMYRVDDSVEGARIAKISRKRVLLNRDDTYYELTMDVSKAVEMSEEDAGLARDDFKETIETAQNGVAEVNRQKLLEKGGGMFALMREVQDHVRAEPYESNGEAVGLKLSGVNEMEIADLAGIKEGDVVKSVDGERIASVNKAMQMFRKARHADGVDVEILRGGDTVELSYRFE